MLVMVIYSGEHSCSCFHSLSRYVLHSVPTSLTRLLSNLQYNVFFCFYAFYHLFYRYIFLFLCFLVVCSNFLLYGQFSLVSFHSCFFEFDFTIIYLCLYVLFCLCNFTLTFLNCTAVFVDYSACLSCFFIMLFIPIPSYHALAFFHHFTLYILYIPFSFSISFSASVTLHIEQLALYYGKSVLRYLNLYLAHLNSIFQST